MRESRALWHARRFFASNWSIGVSGTLGGLGAVGLALTSVEHETLTWLNSAHFFWLTLCFQILGGLFLGVTGLVRGGVMNTERTKAKASVSHAMANAVSKLDEAARLQTKASYDAVYNTALNAFTDCLGVDQPRLCVYLLEHREAKDAQVRVLVFEDSFGRSADRVQHREFEEGTTDAAKANFAALDEHRPLFVPSTYAARKDSSVDANGSYSSYLNVPIYTKNEPHGLLTIDCLNENGLTTHHAPLAWLITKFIAIAWRDNQVAAKGSSPSLASEPYVSHIRTPTGTPDIVNIDQQKGK